MRIALFSSLHCCGGLLLSLLILAVVTTAVTCNDVAVSEVVTANQKLERELRLQYSLDEHLAEAVVAAYEEMGAISMLADHETRRRMLSDSNSNNNSTTSTTKEGKAVARILKCAVSFSQLDFEIRRLDKYNVYFNDDSTMQLAQTGIYKGVDHIREYVGFGFPEYSPYFNFGPVAIPGRKYSKRQFTDLTSSPSGQCTLIIMGGSNLTTNPSYTRCQVNYAQYRMFKIYYNYEKSKIVKIHAYYPKGVFEFLFGYMFDSNKTRSNICSTAADVCLKYMPPITNCTNRLFSLPIVSSGPDGDDYVDGKSQGCRALHAAFAKTNPQHHCAHISIDRVADPDGNFKCQQSAQVDPKTLFTKDQLDSFDQFLKNIDIDPKVAVTAKKNACG